MLKKRMFWFGLGSGLIIGTMLLQLMIWGQDQAIDLPDDVSSSAGNLYTEAQVEEIRAAIREEVTAELETKQPQEEPGQKDEEVLVRGFVVQPGMNSNELTDLLLQLQLIQDKEQFKRLLKAGDKDTKIRTGIYYFTGEPAPEEIIARISPLDEP